LLGQGRGKGKGLMTEKRKKDLFGSERGVGNGGLQGGRRKEINVKTKKKRKKRGRGRGNFGVLQGRKCEDRKMGREN